MKTVLFHVGDAADLETRLEVAFDLAERLQAHLVGLNTLTPASMPAPVIGRGASAVVLAERTERNRRLSAELEERFRGASHRRGLGCEWRAQEGEPLEVVAFHSRYADLVVAGLPRPNTLEEYLVGPPIDRLALVAACPVLLLPAAYGGKTVGRRVLVAWKSSRTCARTLREATPLLRLAEEVTLLTVSEPSLRHVGGLDIATVLARRGVTATIRQDFGKGGDAGAEVLAHARAVGADMVVMGAYGHSRLRELVLGGATQRALSDSPLPLLMSH
ncbi:MAG: universal stress protein [Reyranellaceae bacterium]